MLLTFWVDTDTISIEERTVRWNMKKILKAIIKAIAAIILSIVAATLIIAVICVLFFFPKDPVLDSLPKYEKKEYYTSGGFQDFTDYAKYTYQISESDILQSDSLRAVTEEDIPVILKYVEYFEGCVNVCQDFPSETYDFEKSIISTGDYFFVYNKYEEPERAFWNYNLYYFDVDASILYYFHTNI